MSDDVSRLLDEALVRAKRYVSGVASRPVAPGAAAVSNLAGFDRPLPDGPSPASVVLDELDRLGAPATVASAGPRYFGFVTGGALPATVAASWLAGVWDQNACLVVMSPVAARLEEVALGWLRDVLGLPAGAAGAFVTGATLANFTALAAARHRVLAEAGWDVEADGLIGAPPVTVVVGDEVHSSLVKALGMVGFGRNRVVRVPADAQGRMRVEGMPRLTGPAIVCVQAGNVNTGAFDPTGAICERAREARAWVHVDGAFGLWAAASPATRALSAGVADADSWATDAHKWLNVPYDCGLAFVRDEDALLRAMSVTAAYLPHGETREPSQYTPELSRRARGIEVWAALRSLGRRGLADLVERNCRLARRFADRLRGAGVEVLNDVVLNQVLVAFGDAERTRAVIAAVQEDGTCWCGGTIWQGRTAMRISVSSWATEEDDVDRSVGAIVRVARGLPA